MILKIKDLEIKDLKPALDDYKFTKSIYGNLFLTLPDRKFLSKINVKITILKSLI